ncbi:MAG: signal peptide peptidase SppA [Clostridia bacterium]|nr:signal peptide peptidase SppA [Clostridia bacterium]
MNKKQIFGLLLAFVLLAGSFLITSAVNGHEKPAESESPSMIENLGSYLSGESFNINLPNEDFIAYLDVTGTISEDSSYTSSYSHNFNLNYIDAIIESEYNTGLIMYMNSPGGSVYASDELYLAIEYYKETTGRPVFCYFGPTACSGAYYIAMAADEIYANRNTMTGSIGVIMQMYDLTGLYDKLGVKEVDIVSGKNKAMGSSGQELTEEQRAILQEYVDESYEQFVEIVSRGRGIDADTVRELADGRIYTASGALENGLIDGICGYDDYISDVCQTLNCSYIYQPDSDVYSGIFSSLFDVISGVKSKSESEVLTDLASELRNGVWYYAKAAD